MDKKSRVELGSTPDTPGGQRMAKNTGKGYRRGSVKARSESYNPRTKLWTKQGPDGKFIGR
jgi:hypothetical protein